MKKMTTNSTATTTTTRIPTLQTKTTYCHRFKAELNPCGKRGWFSINDPATEQSIDIKDSFAFVPVLFNNHTSNMNLYMYALTILWKVILATFGWISFISGVAITEPIPAFFFAFISNWGVILCCIYFTLSLVNFMLASSIKQEQNTERISWTIFATWITFVIGIHTTASIAFLFWFVIYDPVVAETEMDTISNPNLLFFMVLSAHGVSFLLLALDGLVLNRIPIRLMHWIGIIVPFDLLYVVWSIIHDLGTNIGNPTIDDNDVSAYNDALYPHILDWKTNPTNAIFFTTITTFVFGPVSFLILWSASTYICGDRLRYYNTTIQKATEDRNPNSHIHDEDNFTSVSSV
jgi:hypothetical protein